MHIVVLNSPKKNGCIDHRSHLSDRDISPFFRAESRQTMSREAI